MGELLEVDVFLPQHGLRWNSSCYNTEVESLEKTEHAYRCKDGQDIQIVKSSLVLIKLIMVSLADPRSLYSSTIMVGQLVLIWT